MGGDVGSNGDRDASDVRLAEVNFEVSCWKMGRTNPAKPSDIEPRQISDK